MNRGRQLWRHEDDLRRRIDALLRLMDDPDADLGSLSAEASLVQSGCAAYRNRLDVAPASERRPRPREAMTA